MSLGRTSGSGSVLIYLKTLLNAQSLRGVPLNLGSKKEQTRYISSSNFSYPWFITLMQWFLNAGLNELGSFFSVAASLAKLRKQSESVAVFDSRRTPPTYNKGHRKKLAFTNKFYLTFFLNSIGWAR